MNRLIILSDLYGNLQDEWITGYIDALSPYFMIKYYDCRVLGEIDLSLNQSHDIHQQFVDFGIVKAVENLLMLEKEKAIILGFSIGGTIAWKAILQGLNASRLYTVSSTRLRKETRKPAIPTHLIFGENDPFKPAANWFEKLDLEPEIIPVKAHELYRESEWIKVFSKQLLELNK